MGWKWLYFAGSLEDQGEHHMEDPHDMLPPGDPADQAWPGSSYCLRAGWGGSSLQAQEDRSKVG